MQLNLGSDVVMVFDECTPYPATIAQASESMELSLRWARAVASGFDAEVSDQESARARCCSASCRVACIDDLRRESLARAAGYRFRRLCLGGLSVGESKAEMQAVLTGIAPRCRSSDRAT